MSPFDVTNRYLVSFLGVLCWLGVPLNFEIILRIVYDKVLRQKLRYILQLSTTFSSLFTLFTNTIEIVHFVFGRISLCSSLRILRIIRINEGNIIISFLISMSSFACCQGDAPLPLHGPRWKDGPVGQGFAVGCRQVSHHLAQITVSTFVDFTRLINNNHRYWIEHRLINSNIPFKCVTRTQNLNKDFLSWCLWCVFCLYTGWIYWNK